MNIFTSGLWGKESDIENRIMNHLQLVEHTLQKFQEGMFYWLEEENLAQANELAFETHQSEGRADDLRREIEKELLGGALLARSRSEMLDLIERTDKLANAGEAAMDFTLLQQIKVPEELKPLSREIIEKSVGIMDPVEKSIRALFKGDEDPLKYTVSIENTEGEIDELERDFIQKLFGLELELAEKILIRQFVEELVEISDRAEDLSDQIEILVATRKT